MTLRERCKAFLIRQRQDAMLRQRDPVTSLTEFVIAETGRAAAPELDDTLALCLYFGSEQDREEFVAAVKEAKPGMIARNVP
jgi:hypothetical protein